jgi:cytochrome c oxidase subunit 4
MRITRSATIKETIVSRKLYAGVFGALLLLTLATYGIAFVDLGPRNVVLALAIAIREAVLVALFFMHLRSER